MTAPDPGRPPASRGALLLVGFIAGVLTVLLILFAVSGS
jgi:hypothetical protein